MKFSRNISLMFFIWRRGFYLFALLLCCMVLSPSHLFANDNKKHGAIIISDDGTRLQKSGSFQIEGDPGGPGMPGDPECITVNFSLNWTECQVHLASFYSSFYIELPGFIFSTNANTWTLNSLTGQPGQPIKISFIEDLFGRSGSQYGNDIPLIWEISVDSQPFVPMNIAPDFSIFHVFNPGPHDFVLRVTCVPEDYQTHGYYSLELAQNIVPIL